MAFRNSPRLKGKLQLIQENVDRFKNENTDFIVLHAGLSKFRTLRTYLLTPDFSKALIYDIIVPKPLKQTAFSVKQENVLKLKADLGALSEEEKIAMKQDMAIQMEFMNNPFFYADVTDLLIDLNFKHYLQTEYNSVFSPNCTIVGSFIEIDEYTDDIFIACMKGESDRPKLKKLIDTVMSHKAVPNIYYAQYKNALDISTVPLHLENFAETAEFFEGLDPAIQKKCKVSPLKTRTEFLKPEDEKILLEDKNQGEIRFAKSLNKKPLRKFSPNMTVNLAAAVKSTGILPSLPQRYVIDKQNYKIPSLRNVFFIFLYNFRKLFYDEYKYPILEKRSDESTAEQEEFEVQEALRRKQEQVKKIQLGATAVQFCKKAEKTDLQSPEKMLYRATRQKFKNVSSSQSLRMSGSADTALINTKRSPGKKFALDYASVQAIKKNFSAFNPTARIAPKTVLIGSHKSLKASPSNKQKVISPQLKKRDISELIPKYKANSYLRSIFSKYHLNYEKLDELLHQFVYLNKVTSYVRNTSSQSDSKIKPKIEEKNERGQKDEQIIKRLFEMTKLDSEEVMDTLNYGDYHVLKVDLNVVKLYYKKLARLPQTIFNRVLLAMGITPIRDMQITLEMFVRIKFYLIEMRADTKEFVEFGKKFIDPTGNKNVIIDDIIRIFKLALIRDDEDNSKRELLLKALLSNFVLCGIVDSEGHFHPDIFEEVYKKGKMNIQSFVKILLS